MKDSLGDRMKDYEDCFRTKITKRSFVMIRIDGKAFHTYTRGLNRPFDEDLISDMNETAKYIVENIQGAKMGFVQSDEISIMFNNRDEIDSELWFDGNIQKIVSVAASMATSKFNRLRAKRSLSNALKNYVYGAGQDDPQLINFDFTVSLQDMKFAEFDCRLFILPDVDEVINYFIWRQQDCVRNSISSVAQSMYSHKQLMGKSTDKMQEMIFQKGTNWNDYADGLKRGRMICRVLTYQKSTKENYDKSQNKDKWVWTADDSLEGGSFSIKRKVWMIEDSFTFSKQQEIFKDILLLGYNFNHAATYLDARTSQRI